MQITNGRIAIIGAGNMGGALVAGIVGRGLRKAGDLIVTDIDGERLSELEKRWKVQISKDNEEAVDVADTVILAVKPQVIYGVLDQIGEQLLPSKLLISIAAGISLSAIEGRLTHATPVVRVMPNIAVTVGEGISALCAGKHARPEHIQIAVDIFRSVGDVVTVEEEQIDVVTGLSGSGPAYVFTMIEALADGGVKLGLPRDVAQKLAVHTTLGAAKLAAQTGEHPAILKDKVSSPGGTTIAGLCQLEAKGFRDALISAVEAATKRSRELGKR